MQATIIRVSRRNDGTPGVFLLDNLPIAVTLERQWKDNLPNVSCIPTGQFICKRIKSPKYGNTFQIIVPGRDLIEFHWGNIDDNTLGCVLLGENFDTWKDGSLSIASSKTAFDEFIRRTLGVDSFMLTVKEAY